MDLQKIRAAAERVAHSEGLEVVDVEWKVGKQRFLRVYIDRLPSAQPQAGEMVEQGAGTGNAPAPMAVSGGISHQDCQAVSEQLSVILDVEDLVPGGPYTLEVSSPGLDRKLSKPADFERFVGRLARITLEEPVENQKFFEGRLKGFSGGMVQMELKGSEKRGTPDRIVTLPFDSIRKANLVVEF